MFSTLMFERHQTKVAIFGGKPGELLQYKGMAGNQVLEWVDLDDEIKTADVKDVRAGCCVMDTVLTRGYRSRTPWRPRTCSSTRTCDTIGAPPGVSSTSKYRSVSTIPEPRGDAC